MGIGRLRTYALPLRQLVYPLYLNQKVLLYLRHLNSFCRVFIIQLNLMLVFFFSVEKLLRSQVPIGGNWAGSGLNPYSLDVLAIFMYRVLQRTNHPVQISEDCRIISYPSHFMLDDLETVLIVECNHSNHRKFLTCCYLQGKLDKNTPNPGYVCCWCFTICMMAW